MNRLNSILDRLRSRFAGERGFTLIELVIVVAVIGILTAIAIPAYGNIQQTARVNTTKSDLTQLRKAIDLARNKQNTYLSAITGTNCTACGFSSDPLTVTKGTGGWVSYNAALKKISDAAGMDVTKLLDTYGRPYKIDENEAETATNYCATDALAAGNKDYGTTPDLVSIRIPAYSERC
jgi:prepilin-type N-terminal cleavage/methylation domain-containing protein